MFNLTLGAQRILRPSQEWLRHKTESWDWTFPLGASSSLAQARTCCVQQAVLQLSPSMCSLTHGYQTDTRKISATSIFFQSMPYRVSMVRAVLRVLYVPDVSGCSRLHCNCLTEGWANRLWQAWRYSRSFPAEIGYLWSERVSQGLGLCSATKSEKPSHVPFCLLLHLLVAWRWSSVLRIW